MLDATPQNLSQLNANVNSILAKVIGVLNAADLSLAAGAIEALPEALQTLVSPTLTAPSDGSRAPILDLLIASPDGTTPPVNVDLLGLVITTSNIEAHVLAQTGDGQVLGNLLYNLANLADPGGPAGLLNLLDLLGSGSLNEPGDTTGGAVTPPATTPEELMMLTVKPLDIDLLGLEIKTNPIVVTLSTQGGDGKLLGNLLNGITTLINVDGIANTLNNVLSTTLSGSFTVDANNNVKYGTTVIGKRTSSGSGTSDLIISFNANVTPAIAQLLVRSITFKTTGGSAGTRKVLFSLTDGDGGSSTEQSVTVNVT